MLTQQVNLMSNLKNSSTRKRQSIYNTSKRKELVSTTKCFAKVVDLVLVLLSEKLIGLINKQG